MWVSLVVKIKVLQWHMPHEQWSWNMPDMSCRLLLMSGREVRPCQTFCPAVSIHIKCPTRKTRMTTDIYQSSNGKKCLTWAQNVQQSTEGLPYILFGTPEIIFVRAQNVQQSTEGLPDILSGTPEIIFVITAWAASMITFQDNPRTGKSRELCLVQPPYEFQNVV